MARRRQARHAKCLRCRRCGGRVLGSGAPNRLPEPHCERAFLGAARGGVDRGGAEARMAHPARDQIKGHARLKGGDAEGVAQAARRGGEAANAGLNHHMLIPVMSLGHSEIMSLAVPT